MRSLCLFGLVAATAAQKHPIRQGLADRINDDHSLGWKAHRPEHNPLANLTPEEIMGMMGLQPSAPPQTTKPARLGVTDIPESFDAREKFASCKKSIRNQKKCGSCWAFAAAETLTDNLCVLGSDPPVLSPQDFVSCDAADHGCKGGTLPGVWDYIDSHGAVSDDCMPYDSGDGSNHTCPLPGCSSAGDAKAYKCPKAHSMMDSDEEIQAAVMTVGAVEVGFTVMEDFMNYKSGIYKYKEGAALGGHAVKIVGWGKQLETFYWIVQNSWGEAWGEDGYFRIVNWHDDKMSAIAIGGGFACVQGATPTPPTPAPKPDTCKDIVSYCNKYGREKCATMSYLIPVCQKTCGCCDDVLRPSYCNKTQENEEAGAESEEALESGSLKLTWSDCGDSSTHGHITSLTPDTLTIGGKTSLAGKGSVDEAITGASYTVSAKAGPVPVFSHNGDACKAETIKLPLGVGEIDMKGFKCPIAAGDVELDLDVTLSSKIPAKLARTTIELKATASNGDKALCVQIKTEPASIVVV